MNNGRSMNVTELNDLLGNIDIYLLDSILKGYFKKRRKILDSGCGEGRNILFFLKNGYEVFGLDKNPSAIKLCQMSVRTINKNYDASRFCVGDVTELPFPDQSFDAVLSSAVMHFAIDESEFMKMMKEAVRVLRKEGLLFVRMASNIGIEKQSPENRFTFYLTRDHINVCLDKFYLEKIEPVKSVNVDDSRVMTTLILKKLK